MAKLQFATLSNLQEFLNLHNVQIDSKISEAVKNSIKTVSQSEDGVNRHTAKLHCCKKPELTPNLFSD